MTSPEHDETHLQSGFDVLERLNVGITILDLELRPIYANRRARELFDERDGIAVDHGKIQTHPGQLEKALAETAARCIEPRRAENDGSRPPMEEGHAAEFMRITRPSRRRAYQVAICAMDRPDETGSWFRPSLLLVIVDPNRVAAGEAQALQAIHGLTTAEAEVALGLSRGRSLPGIAAERGVTTQTVRNQLKRAMTKTSTRRQAELAALVRGGIATLLTH